MKITIATMTLLFFLNPFQMKLTNTVIYKFNWSNLKLIWPQLCHNNKSFILYIVCRPQQKKTNHIYIALLN